MKTKFIIPDHRFTPVDVDGIRYAVGIGGTDHGGGVRSWRILANCTQGSVGITPDTTRDQAFAWWNHGFEAPPPDTEAGRIVAAMLERGMALRL